jgi:hypothetical protein
MRDIKDYVFMVAVAIGILLALGAAGVSIYLSDSPTWTFKVR